MRIKDYFYKIGFFQYYTNNDLFMMEEIQIKPQYQGKEQIFRKLYGFIITGLSDKINKVEYTIKENYKSQSILNKLGLEVIGENKNRNSFHFRGKFSSLLQWYNRTE